MFRRGDVKTQAEINAEAIRVVRGLLERCEERLIKVRGYAALHDFEKGMDRDQYMYCMGKADECREILLCLGVFDQQTSVKVKS